MGAYLASPITEKESEDLRTDDGKVSFGVSGMQGWRAHMEDAHLAETNFNSDPNSWVVGVFDGHGGPEVANFCKYKLGKSIKDQSQFAEGKYDIALQKAFLEMDDQLFRPYYRKELAKWKNEPDGEPLNNLPGIIARIARGSGADDPELAPIQNLAKELLEDEDDAKKNEELKEAVDGEIPKRKDLSIVEKVEDPLHEEILKDVPPHPENDNPDFKDDDPEGYVSAGCTAVVVLKKDGKLFVANAGDSRAVICRAGEAIALTTDHKPGVESEDTRIHAAAGYITNGRVNGNLNLTRAIGDLMYKKNDKLTLEEQIITSDPELKIHELSDEDEFLILGCDGIWEVKTNQEIVDFCKVEMELYRKGEQPLSRVCEKFMDDNLSPDITSTEGMGCDNMTMVIVDLKASLGVQPATASSTVANSEL